MSQTSRFFLHTKVFLEKFLSLVLIASALFVFTFPFADTARSADRNECVGFGGKKICWPLDINPVEGSYNVGADLYTACFLIGKVGGKANNGYSSYEVVGPSDSATPVWQTTLMDGRGVNNCTNSAYSPSRSGYWPALFENEASCSSGNLAGGPPPLCVPDNITDDKNLGNKCPQCGNPINYAFGNKYQREVDYENKNRLSFIRYYNSSNLVSSPGSMPGDIGRNWRHSFKYVIALSAITGKVAKVYRPDGAAVSFINLTPDLMGSKWVSDGDVNDTLIRLVGSDGVHVGWEYHDAAEDSIEKYGEDGRVTAINYGDGGFLKFGYSDDLTDSKIAPGPGLLIKVTNHFDQAISFEYDVKSRLVTMTTPRGMTYKYNYNEFTSIVTNRSLIYGGTLTSVEFPDLKTRRYWYNEQSMTSNNNYPWALTGITDENNARFATFRYDGSRRPISTEHAGGVEKYVVKYDNLGSRTVVTDPLGTSRLHTLIAVQNLYKESGQPSQDINGSGAATITYDVNGNVALRVDFNGNKSSFTYDLARNLRIKSINAFGTNLSTTTTTQWHPVYRLPVQISEPKRMTNYAYDENKNLVEITRQATSDINGDAGLSAQTIGASQIWKATFSEYGKIRTSTGPMNELVTYDYDNSGNLKSVTNSLGHMVSYSNYDADGNVGRIASADGIVSEFGYTSRGWVAFQNVGGEVTRYEYDGVGSVISLTSPDNTKVTYGYDDAHRLTSVTDSLGNKIVYALDVVGNRVSEIIQLPSGDLAHKITRVFDNMSRLQSQTGGTQ